MSTWKLNSKDPESAEFCGGFCLVKFLQVGIPCGTILQNLVCAYVFESFEIDDGAPTNSARVDSGLFAAVLHARIIQQNTINAMKFVATLSALVMLATPAAAFAPPQAFTRPVVSLQAEKLPIMADESVMAPKAHGSSEKPVQKSLRWGCDFETADRICNFNRHYAEFAGYWTAKTDFLSYVKELPDQAKPIEFYDSVTGALLFTAPKGRTMQEFIAESESHGWPSFRDEEVNWEYVRTLKDGECISTTGTHLGHNLPDRKGNRYCINLVSVAGEPSQ
jgi:peptide methionine sulfoxide reductase MsrB